MSEVIELRKHAGAPAGNNDVPTITSAAYPVHSLDATGNSALQRSEYRNRRELDKPILACFSRQCSPHRSQVQPLGYSVGAQLAAFLGRASERQDACGLSMLLI
jgi:hypothetical protein